MRAGSCDGELVIPSPAYSSSTAWCVCNTGGPAAALRGGARPHSVSLSGSLALRPCFVCGRFSFLLPPTLEVDIWIYNIYGHVGM